MSENNFTEVKVVSKRKIYHSGELRIEPIIKESNEMADHYDVIFYTKGNTDDMDVIKTCFKIAREHGYFPEKSSYARHTIEKIALSSKNEIKSSYEIEEIENLPIYNKVSVYNAFQDTDIVTHSKNCSCRECRTKPHEEIEEDESGSDIDEEDDTFEDLGSD